MVIFEEAHIRSTQTGFKAQAQCDLHCSIQGGCHHHRAHYKKSQSALWESPCCRLSALWSDEVFQCNHLPAGKRRLYCHETLSNEGPYFLLL